MGAQIRPLYVLLLILIIRLTSVFVVQTWFVPDEYYQSLEVAHKLTFDYGYITWEWKEGIRSFLYPSLIADYFLLLKFLALDTPAFLIYGPRILQAVLSSISDFCFYRWTGNRKWGLFLILTSYFWYYCSSRTLINTFETCFSTMALSSFPFRDQVIATNPLWLIFATICCYIRPSSAIIWGPLVIYSIVYAKSGKLKLLLANYLPALLLTLCVLVGIDYIYYGRLVLTPWEFIRFNLLKDVGSNYGTHPWYWYWTIGLWTVLGGTSIAVVWSVIDTIKTRYHTNQICLMLSALYIVVHSFIAHKEFRFLLPILPLLLYPAQDTIARWSRKAKRQMILGVALALFILNVIPAVYLGMWHQRGSIDVMPILRDIAQKDTANTRILFAMPCHSTPLYSHLHVNVSTRIMDCTPPAESIGEEDESDRFHREPTRWFRTEYSVNKPTHIVMYDSLVERLQQILPLYQLKHTLFHTHFPQGNIGKNILIYEKVKRDDPLLTSHTL